MAAKLPFVSKRSINEWKQVHTFQMAQFNRMMASDYQPTRLPYGISRLLARSTTPKIVRVVLAHRWSRGERLTYREVDSIIKRYRGLSG